MAKPSIGIIGGTGKQGGGLALRWAAAGYSVQLGSRNSAQAAAAADVLNMILGRQAIEGVSNDVAADRADIVVLAVLYRDQIAAALALREHLRDKILIDVTAPIVAPDVGTVQLPEGGSAVAALQRAIGPQVRVVGAFQNVAAVKLRNLDDSIDCDVLISSDSPQDAAVVIELANAVGLRGFHAGPLANSAAAESLTAVLLTLNRARKTSNGGIRLTGFG
jgi:NADPH-dependent F420 reductase